MQNKMIKKTKKGDENQIQQQSEETVEKMNQLIQESQDVLNLDGYDVNDDFRDSSMGENDISLVNDLVKKAELLSGEQDELVKLLKLNVINCV